MANFHSYSTSTWRWIVLVGDDMVADFPSKWEADRKAAEVSGTVKRVRW